MRGDPSADNGEADLSSVHAVFETLGRVLDHPVVVALRSTVPVGTTRDVERRLNEALAGRDLPWSVPVLANPEFLRTGRAIEDFLHPSRVVVGRAQLADDEHVELLSTLYRPLEGPDPGGRRGDVPSSPRTRPMPTWRRASASSTSWRCCATRPGP